MEKNIIVCGVLDVRVNVVVAANAAFKMVKRTDHLLNWYSTSNVERQHEDACNTYTISRIHTHTHHLTHALTILRMTHMVAGFMDVHRQVNVKTTGDDRKTTGEFDGPI